MEARYLVASFIKGFSALIMINVLLEAINIWMMIRAFDSYASDGDRLLISGSYFCIFSLVAFFMWKFPITISEKLLPFGIRKTHLNINVSAENILVLVLIVIGVYKLSSAIPDLAHNIIYINQLSALNYGVPVDDPEMIAMLVGTIMEIVVGLALVLGSVGIAKSIRKIRNYPQ